MLVYFNKNSQNYGLVLLPKPLQVSLRLHYISALICLYFLESTEVICVVLVLVLGDLGALNA